ncbi:MAG: three-Cys-motif partner protein TcmP [Thermoplasmata archaeon]|nr:three-Cys-motif partner protein TcmP [Thermoplasmata archaeon]
MDAVWDLKPHTRAKHEILRRYLAAWFPILKTISRTGLNYIDGFAGPGVYSRGEEGSPLIALRTAVEHVLPMPDIDFLFIEKNTARAESLRRAIAERFPDLPDNFSYEVFNDEFSDVCCTILDELDSNDKVLAPTFTFVDPFGYAGFPLNLLRRLLTPPSSEVLVTFMASRLRRFLDESHEECIDELFDSQDWRVAQGLTGDDRTQFLLSLYQKKLIDSTPAEFVLAFEMVGRDGNTIYWLIFATKHPKGCQVMKEAMWKADPTGTYRYFDSAAGVRRFVLDEDDPEWARQAQAEVYNHFRGKRVPVEEIEDHVAPTTFLWRKRKILVPLEDTGKILEVHGRDRRRTYPDGCLVTFAP